MTDRSDPTEARLAAEAARALALLRLQLDWGADEALGEMPLDRRAGQGEAMPAALGAGEADAAPGAAAPIRAVPAPLTPAPLTPAAPAPAAPARPAARLATGATAGAALEAAAGAATEVTDLDALHRALDGLHQHPLRATATRTVRPAGRTQAGLLLLADAPGAEDDRAGEAFSGAPGQVLDRVLASAGLGRERMLLAHLVPWRPPGGRPPSPEEIAPLLPFLHRLLVLAAPARLVLAGAAARRALAPAAGRVRAGDWIEASGPALPRPLPALVMPPPEQWLLNARSREATWTGLLALRAALEAGRPG